MGSSDRTSPGRGAPGAPPPTKLMDTRMEAIRAMKNSLYARVAACCGVVLACTALATRGGEAPSAAEDYEPTRVQKALAGSLDLRRWDTDQGLDELIDLPSGPGNAAGHYAKLETLYPEENKSYREQTGEETFEVPRNARGIAHILAAGKMRTCRLVPDCYEPMTELRADAPEAVAILAYTDAALARAEACEKAGLHDQVEELLRAVLVMGWHFTEDRPNLLVYRLGLRLQSRACQRYAEYLQRQLQMARSRRFTDYARSIRDITLQTRKKTALLSSIAHYDSLLACVKCATEDEDPLWRQEACVNLGIMRLGAPDASGQLHPDPAQQKVALNALSEVARADQQQHMRELAMWCIKEMPDLIDELQTQREQGSLPEQ